MGKDKRNKKDNKKFVMRNVAELLDSLDLNTIALASNIKYGNAIYNRGGVSVIRKSETEVEIWVGGLDGDSTDGGGSRRRVTFWIDKDKLVWRCTGNPKNHEIFCKHCVAAALYLKDDIKK